MKQRIDSTSRILQLSVTELVGLYARDLGLGPSGVDLSSDATTGIDVHQRIQKKLSSSLRVETEVPLRHVFAHRHIKIELTGRADFVTLNRDQTCIVTEIKSCDSPTAAHRAASKDPSHPHQFQASLYAWMIEKSRDMSCQSEVLYASHKTSSIRRLSPTWKHDQLESKLSEVLDAQLQHIDILTKRKKRQRRLANHLTFPFPGRRPSQNRFMDFVTESLKRRQPCLIEAPTGAGKTLSALFPGLQFTLSKGKSLFFGTSKNSQKIGCVKAARSFNGPRPGGPCAVSLESRESLCLQKENPVCAAEHCRFAKNYGKKLRHSRILNTVLKNDLAFDAQSLREWGRHYEICPFELALDITSVVDLVICDYNHITCPSAQLNRFFSAERDPNRVQLLFDEAHCLPERVCAQLSLELQTPSRHHSTAASVRFFRKISEGIDKFILGEDVGSEPSSLGGHFPLKQRLTELLQCSTLAIQKYTKSMDPLPFNDPAWQLHQDVITFCSRLSALELGDQHPYSLLARRSDATVKLKLLCKDSKSYLHSFFQRHRAPLFMSATLSPADHFMAQLGLSDQSEMRFLKLPSDFPKDNRKLVIVPQLTSLYRYRETQIPKMANTISRILALQPVNTIVFSPSFELCQIIAEQCCIPDLFDCSVQLPRMQREEINALLRRLVDADRPQVLFAVMRGPFSEGVDLPGKALESVILTGPPLAPPSTEQSLRLIYEKSQGPDAFERCVVTPAMIQVNQAIGRLIRTPTDRGTCFLLDFRFLEQMYFEKIAPEWRQNLPRSHVSFQLSEELLQFWSGVTDVSAHFSDEPKTVKSIEL